MRGKKIIIGVLCGIGAIAIGLGAWKYKSLVNGVRRLASTPEEYFRYVEQKSAETRSSVIGNWYEIAKSAFDFSEDKTYEGSVSVELGEVLHDLVRDAAEEDISAIEKVGMTVSASVGEGMKKSAFNGAVLLNDTEVISGTYWFDLAETLGFLQIPKLSKDIVYISPTDVDEDAEYVISAGDALEILNEICEKLPEKERIEILMNRYAKVALSCINDVGETTDTLRAEGLSMRCTKLTTVLSGKELSEITETVLDTMLEDEELEKLVKEVTAAQDFVDEDEIYDEFYEYLEELYETVDEMEEFEEDIIYSVWVDENGTIVGRRLEIGDDAEFAEFSYAVVREKNTIGVNIEADIEGDKFSAKGTGALEGMTVTGEFTVKIDGERVVKVQLTDIDLNAWMNGRRKGTVTLLPIGTFKEELKDLEEELEYYDISLKLQDLALIFSYDFKENTSSASYAIELDEKPFLKASYETGQKAGGELNFPNRAAALELKSGAEFLEWFSGADLQSVFETLSEEGVSEGWLTEVDISIDSMKFEAAVLYAEQGNYQKAKDMFVALGEHIYAEDFAYYCEGMLLYEKGKPEEAMELFEEIDGYHWEMSSGIVACKYELAEKYLAEGSYEEAAEFYKAVMADYYAYDEYEDANTKQTYAEAMQMMQNGDYTTAEGWLSEIADHYLPAQEALEECIRQREEELAYIQRPAHWLYPTDYASYAEYVVIPERYIGIPMEKVTGAEFEDYLLTNTEGAMSYGGEISEEEKARLYEKCEEEKYTFALMEYLLKHGEVLRLDEAALREKAKIDLYRYQLELVSMGFEWDLIVDTYGSEEELLALFEGERRAREEVLLIAYAIAKKEGLMVTEEEFDYYVKDMSGEFGITEQDFLQANSKEILDDAFLIEKSLLFMIENADIQ